MARTLGDILFTNDQRGGVPGPPESREFHPASRYVPAAGRSAHRPSHSSNGTLRQIRALFQRDMGVDIAAPEEDGCAGEQSWIVAWRAGWSDEGAAQGEHACISVSVTGREFQRGTAPCENPSSPIRCE